LANVLVAVLTTCTAARFRDTVVLGMTYVERILHLDDLMRAHPNVCFFDDPASNVRCKPHVIHMLKCLSRRYRERGVVFVIHDTERGAMPVDVAVPHTVVISLRIDDRDSSVTAMVYDPTNTLMFVERYTECAMWLRQQATQYVHVDARRGAELDLELATSSSSRKRHHRA
jgi:hypothetical protein